MPRVAARVPIPLVAAPVAGARGLRDQIYNACLAAIVEGRLPRGARLPSARQLAADAAVRLRRWIWIHHAPPKTTPISWDGQRYYGDVELEEWIGKYTPDIVFSGHVHQSPFSPGGSWVDRIASTWVFNAGRQYGAPPTYVIVDTDRQLALWFSAAGNQVVRLDQPLQRPIPKLNELPDWLA